MRRDKGRDGRVRFVGARARDGRKSGEERRGKNRRGTREK